LQKASILGQPNPPLAEEAAGVVDAGRLRQRGQRG
jgi:hypothetical protein